MSRADGKLLAMRHPARRPMVRGLIATLVVVMALAASVTRTRAGTVAITFDRDAVRELLVAGLPPPSRIRVPGVAEFLLRLDAPDAVRFSSYGQVEMALASEAVDFLTPVWYWFVGENDEGGKVVGKVAKCVGCPGAEARKAR